MRVSIYLLIIALCLGLAAWCVFLWAIRSGQFHDVEEISRKVRDLDRRE